MSKVNSYIMENGEEVVRLEIKTDPDDVRKHAEWCGLKPGIRVLDVGCGTGKVTSILHAMIQPGGEILGVDASEERIDYAKKQYGRPSGIDFRVLDFRAQLDDLGNFDLVWTRFVLEYFRKESPAILRNLSACLKPGGSLCLIDLDHNCLNHYELHPQMEEILQKLMMRLERDFNFDPYSGRKLYSYLYDLGYENIQMDLVAHHLIYGKIRDEDMFNWIKKVEVISKKTPDLFKSYPGGHDAFFSDFVKFFQNPRRFTYTPLILCKGIKPLTF